MTTTSTKKSATPKAGHNSKRTLDVIAGEIHALERRSAFDYGKLLIEAKEACEHGTWLRWLDEEFDWSPDTADNYTAAARLEAKFRTVRNLKVPMRVIYDLAGDLDDRDLPAIIEALTTLSKSAPKGKTVSVAAAENVIDLARLRARHGDYPEATLDALDLIPEDEWAKLAAEKLKELRPTTEEEADRLIAEFKPSEPEWQPESEPNDDDDDDEGSEPAEQLVEEPARARPAKKARKQPAKKAQSKTPEAPKAAASAPERETPARAQQDVGPQSTCEVERLRARVDELQAEKRQLEIKITGLESENAELKAENAKLKAENAELKAETTIEERAAALAAKGVREPIPDFLRRKPTEVVS
jgi:hypothetical protein